jgi:hypothetical protein
MAHLVVRSRGLRAVDDIAEAQQVICRLLLDFCKPWAVPDDRQNSRLLTGLRYGNGNLRNGTTIGGSPDASVHFW